MSKRSWIVVAAVVVLWGASGPPSLSPAGGEEIGRVTITNFPSVQSVDGTVTVASPIPATRFLTVFEVVSPADRSDLHLYTDAGVVDLSGFSTAVLSLGGEVKGSSPAGGTVGAVLIPAESAIEDAFIHHQTLLFPLMVEAELGPPGVALFGNSREPARLAFPRYRVYLFNSGRNAVRASLYIYLSS